MDNGQKRRDARWTWAMAGIPAGVVLCCGLPLLAGAFGLTAAAGFLAARQLWVFAGMAALMGAVMLVSSRRKGRPCEAGPSRDAGPAADSRPEADSAEGR